MSHFLFLYRESVYEIHWVPSTWPHVVPPFWLAPSFELLPHFWMRFHILKLYFPRSFESKHLVRFQPCTVPLSLLVNLLGQSLLSTQVGATSDCYVRWPYHTAVNYVFHLPYSFISCCIASSLLFAAAPSGTFHHIRSLLERSNVGPVYTYPAASLHCILSAHYRYPCIVLIMQHSHSAYICYVVVDTPPCTPCTSVHFTLLPGLLSWPWTCCMFAIPTPHIPVKFAQS